MAGVQEAVEFVDVVGGIACLGEELFYLSVLCSLWMEDLTYRVDDYAASTALYDHLGLGLDGHAMIGAEQDAVVAGCALVLVSKQREHSHRP